MLRLLKIDLLLQFRQGFWLVYAVMTLIYLAILFNIPAGNRLFASVIFIFLDTSVLGTTFVGALILLEKQQNILQSMFVTPLKLRTYIWSKGLSLTILSFITSSMLYILPNGIDKSFFSVAFSFTASSLFFTLLGIGLSARADTINRYIWIILLTSMGLSITLFPYILGYDSFWVVLLPPTAAFELMLVSFKDIPGWRLIADMIILSCWCVGSYYFARDQFRKHILN